MTIINSFARAGKYALMLSVLNACTSGDPVSVPPGENLNRVWDIESNVLSLNMLTGDEFQVTVSMFDIAGRILPPNGTVRYRSEQPSNVSVDSSGKLRALNVSDGVRIFSSVTSEGRTFTDTISVAVFANPVDIESIEITNINPVLSYKSYGWFNVRVNGRDGLPANGFSYSIRSLDKKILQVTPYNLYGAQVGKTKVVAEVNAFGRSFVDTVEIRVLYANTGSVDMSWNLNAMIGVNGSITFSNYWYPARSVTVVFDRGNPASPVPAGDTIVVPSFESVTRSFAVPGIYGYSVADTTIKGSVIVRENPTF